MTNSKCLAMHEVFALGFSDGIRGNAAQTAREVYDRHPLYGSTEATLYLNGAEDGARGDRYRLEMKCYCCGKGPTTDFVEQA